MLVESDYSQAHAAGDANAKGFKPLSRQNSGMFIKEDQSANASHTAATRLQNGRRPPQRSRTTHEHIPAGPQILTVMRPAPQPQHHVPTPRAPIPPKAAATTEAETLTTSTPQQQENLDSVTPLSNGATPHSRRPKLGAPRRSYSVMDYEPVPPEQLPSYGPLTLSTLPSELHFAIFECLDPIDATCLGLTNQYFYSIHRRMHGSVPLSVRRDGPNELEWAWHRAALPTPSRSPASTTNMVSAKEGHLATLRVRGKGLCRKCGVSRCELHKHIVEWMPEKYEYCPVRDKFVPKPGEEARASCYMSNPTNTSRCGRHRIRKDKKLE